MFVTVGLTPEQGVAPPLICSVECQNSDRRPPKPALPPGRELQNLKALNWGCCRQLFGVSGPKLFKNWPKWPKKTVFWGISGGYRVLVFPKLCFAGQFSGNCPISALPGPAQFQLAPPPQGGWRNFLTSPNIWAPQISSPCPATPLPRSSKRCMALTVTLLAQNGLGQQPAHFHPNTAHRMHFRGFGDQSALPFGGGGGSSGPPHEETSLQNGKFSGTVSQFTVPKQRVMCCIRPTPFFL